MLQKSLHGLSCWTVVGSQLPVANARSYWGERNLPNRRGRSRPNRVWQEEFSGYRSTKVMRIQLPDYEKQRRLELRKDEPAPDEMRREMKKNGMKFPSFVPGEAPVFVSATGSVIEPYDPPEAESSSYASLTKKDVGEKLKLKTFRATRKIRKHFDENFDPTSFATTTAVDVYIKAHQALAEKREKDLLKYATEKVYPEMLAGIDKKSMYWKFVKSLEPPKVVHARIEDFLKEGNSFAQVTVRFNTQQILAVYDRFGRLIHGHPHVAKDVLEYVVFENHVASLYGKWRVHAKIIPDWLSAQRPSSHLTQVIDFEDLADYEKRPKEDKSKEEDESDEGKEGEKSKILDKFGRRIE